MFDEPVHLLQTQGRLAIVGAGSVGATIAYATMIRGLASQIVLIDKNEAKARAEAADLNHGRRFVPNVHVRAGTMADCRGAQIVVVAAGAKQNPGESRLDLTRTNVAIFRELIPAISEVAPEAILLIVTNPVDVLTYAAAHLHHGGPRRVMGSGTVLDSARFVSLISERLGVAPRSIHAYIVGEHGDSELPLWSSADVGATPLHCVKGTRGQCLTDAERREIAEDVRSAAARLIADKGVTNWAIGLASARIIEAIRRDESTLLTVSTMLNDYHGVNDLCLSTPCLVNAHGVEGPMPVPMSEEESAAFRASAETIRHACREVELTDANGCFVGGPGPQSPGGKG